MPNLPGEYGGAGANALRERFLAYMSPEVRAEYAKAAIAEGVKLGANVRLIPLMQPVYTTIRDDTDTHTDIPVSLNADVPSQELRVYFQDTCFIRRLTATVHSPVVVANALAGAAGVPLPPFEPQVLENVPFEGISAEDFIYVQLERDGRGQIYQQKPVPLSELTNDGAHGRLFEPIPIVKAGGSINISLSIMPPQNENFVTPPFIERIGLVCITFHTEVYNEFGA